MLKASIKKGDGLDKQIEIIEKILKERSIYIEKVYAYSEAGKIQLIRKYGQLLSEEYVPEGILVKANVPNEIYGRI